MTTTVLDVPQMISRMEMTWGRALRCVPCLCASNAFLRDACSSNACIGIYIMRVLVKRALVMRALVMRVQVMRVQVMLVLVMRLPVPA